jgi:2'-5' RNA ligase
MSDLIRSFIAVTVPAHSAEKLRAAQDRLRAANGSVKWVKPDGLHITLKFLGGVENDRLRAVWGSVTAALDGERQFIMRFRGVGAFPSAGRARVVWAGVAEGAHEMAELASRVERACAGHGFPREDRPFRAHITLGRVRQPRPNEGLAAAMAELADTALGEARVDRVVLMKSELRPEGAVYDVLEDKLLDQGDTT